jgi:hypothetical protein
MKNRFYIFFLFCMQPALLLAQTEPEEIKQCVMIFYESKKKKQSKTTISQSWLWRNV